MSNSMLHILLEMKHTEKHHPCFNLTQNVILILDRGLSMIVKNQNIRFYSKWSELAFWWDLQKIFMGTKAWENPCSPIPNYQGGQDDTWLTIWAWGIALETKWIQREEENEKQLWEGNLDNITQFKSAWLTKWLPVKLCFPTLWNHYFQTKQQLKLWQLYEFNLGDQETF